MPKLRFKQMYLLLIHDALSDRIDQLEARYEKEKTELLNSPLIASYKEACVEYGCLNYGKLRMYVGQKKRTVLDDHSLSFEMKNAEIYHCDLILEKCDRHDELSLLIARYKAIDYVIVEASKKKDSYFLDNGLGPDAPPEDEYNDGQSDEDLLRLLDQID